MVVPSDPSAGHAILPRLLLSTHLTIFRRPHDFKNPLFGVSNIEEDGFVIECSAAHNYKKNGKDYGYHSGMHALPSPLKVHATTGGEKMSTRWELHGLDGWMDLTSLGDQARIGATVVFNGRKEGTDGG